MRSGAYRTKTRANRRMTNHNFADVLSHSDHKCAFIDAKATNKSDGYSYDAAEVTKSEVYVDFPGEVLPHQQLDNVVVFITCSGFTKGLMSGHTGVGTNGYRSC